jgi:hypothetical protein
LVFDDIIIGSGLSALATAIGLPVGRRVLVLAGPTSPHSLYYQPEGVVPCAHHGFGGLGNFWHGVIPMATSASFAGGSAEFSELFRRFYPLVDLDSRLGQQQLFVPWRAIRPGKEWARLVEERGSQLAIRHEVAEGFSLDSVAVAVEAGGVRHAARRLWICGGTLHTPTLLDRSLHQKVSRATVSDHVLIYLGQVDRLRHPHVQPAVVERSAHGMWLRPRAEFRGNGLCTLRPARFEYRQLDRGIEARAAFGLPLGNAVSKILRASSAGLLAEALYNRAGLFPRARMQSAYAQIEVSDAHELMPSNGSLAPRLPVIRQTTDAMRRELSIPELTASRRPEIFIPMIHLHHSVDDRALRTLGVNTPQSNIQVSDASVLERIGPEHHSFRMMVGAYSRARASR